MKWSLKSGLCSLCVYLVYEGTHLHVCIFYIGLFSTHFGRVPILGRYTQVTIDQILALHWTMLLMLPIIYLCLNGDSFVLWHVLLSYFRLFSRNFRVFNYHSLCILSHISITLSYIHLQVARSSTGVLGNRQPRIWCFAKHAPFDCSRSCPSPCFS